jgi:hypothetical protein
MVSKSQKVPHRKSEGTIGCSLQPAIGYVSVRTSLTIARARAQEMRKTLPLTKRALNHPLTTPMRTDRCGSILVLFRT